MKLNPILSALLVGSTLLCAQGAAFGQAKPIELRYSSGAPPKGNPWVMQIERFAKDVEEESKGEVKIQPFLASQLGSEQDTVQQVARGRIDMGGYSGGSAALIVPEVALLLMPFYFRNAAEADCVIDNHMTKIVTDAFAKKGVQFMGWTSVGSIDMFGKKPFMAPPDLKGAKAAIYANKTQAMFFTTMGASVNPLGLPEWIPAFQTGMADVVFTTITYGLPSGLTKVAPVVSKVNAYDSPGLTLMNKGVWDKLSKPHQEAMLRATARNPSTKYREEIRGFEGTLFGMLKQGGGQVVEATQEQRDAWRKAMEPVYPQIVKETGGESAAFYTAMEAGRKACAK
jgi:TRAP-type transport system periplasmic protein